ncbi:site-specific integrase [Methylobacterium sp. Leaf399]|uniref:site-specific integrase n=1 Tax=Methylobacterium sp. Leaf399 TaxID=1736364 RepID=UPI000B23B19E|nr:site-specific integrase [Methylobacterium sp. Leaf399]
MAALFNVVLRKTIYHFRRRVPDDLRPCLERRELVRSLATSDPRTAKLRACRLYVASETLFSVLRTTPMLTQAQLARMVQDFYSLLLDTENLCRLREQPINEVRRSGRARHYGAVAQRAREALACNRLDEARFLTEGMLKKQGIVLRGLPPDDLARAEQAMLRAGIDAAEALKARYEGDFNYEPRDRLLKLQLDALNEGTTQTAQPKAQPTAQTPAETKAETDKAPPFSVVGTKFRASQVATKVWDQQTAAQAGATYRLFVDVCGDKPVSAYTRKDVGRFREQVQRLPNDYGKHPRYRDVSVEQILAVHEAASPTNRKPVITQRTVKRHFSALSTMWSAAVSKEDATTNIFSGFRFANSRKASEQRDMWERADLARLFATPIWTGCASAGRRTAPGDLILRDEKFWLPLIAVFSGLRQEEICQLQVEDIRQDEDVWFFDINDRPPRKIKNTTAVRHVPLHAELIRLGFLAHVETQRRRRQTRVFANLTPGGADGRLGHAFTKWFTRYRRDVGLYRPGLDFHSFRHTATTLMHQAGVSVAVIDHITGHTTAGETARYTKRSTLVQMKASIDTIGIGVDLTALYGKGQPPA